MAMSKEYAAAYEASNVAIRAFRQVQEDYRARRIGDAEFLAGKALYDAAMKDFDAAFARRERPGGGALMRVKKFTGGMVHSARPGSYGWILDCSGRSVSDCSVTNEPLTCKACVKRAATPVA